MTSEQVLLYLDRDHISSHIGGEKDVEHTFRRRGTKIKAPSDLIVIYLQQAGFYNATFLRGYKIVPGLITGLIERWRPETHTFHFSFGECTITLEDVAIQLGVPINGNTLVGHNTYDVFDICNRFLGKMPSQSDVKGLRVKITWLEAEFNVTESSTKQELIFAARAYILQIIGGILMPDTSGNLVHTQYLLFLDDFLTTRGYSWGSAILAFLYHEMCKATIMKDGKKTSDIGGCLILVQSWAWYRLPYLTPIIREPVEFPLAGRWRHDLHKAGVVHNNVKDIRLKIETEGKNQFIWTPYEDPKIKSCIPQNVRECSVFWGTVVPLIHFSIIEFQCADRVLRQFNFHQLIPRSPFGIDKIHNGVTKVRFNENWIVKQAHFIALWNDKHMWLPEDCTPIEDDDFDLNSEYSKWFSENGKPFLASVADRKKWHKDPRCSFEHVDRLFGSGQSSRQPTDDTIRDWPTDWDAWVPVEPPGSPSTNIG